MKRQRINWRHATTLAVGFVAGLGTLTVIGNRVGGGGGTIDAGIVAGPPDATAPVGGGVIDLNTAWQLHTIAPGGVQLDGSDGVDLADIDADGDLDVTSGYEQGQKVSVSLHPAGAAVESTWPTVIIPATQNVTGPEDSIFFDIDRDGWKDVLIGAEGGTRIWIMYSPTSVGSLLTASAWTRVEITASVGTRWMRLAIADIDENGIFDVVAGGKEGGATDASVSYFTSSTPRTAGSWTEHVIEPSGWVMSMYVRDVDTDGDLDIVYSDREQIDIPGLDSSRQGIRWLESNGASPTPSFTAHQISPVQGEYKFITLVDWEGDGDTDIVACRSNASLNQSFLYLNGGTWTSTWTSLAIAQPASVGQCQDPKPADIDADGDKDMVFTYAAADGALSGVVWLKNTGTNASPVWERGEIDGSVGIKYDNVELVDIDADGDLDAITSEQHADTDGNSLVGPGLGAVWYENPRLP